MKSIFNIFTILKQIFTYLKRKIKMHVFNLLNTFEEQFGTWYFFELNIKTTNFRNEYSLPVFCCMRERIHAESLMHQIQRDLNANFVVLGGEITEMTKQEKDRKIGELETKYAGQEVIELQTEIYKIKEKGRISPEATALFSEEDLTTGNLDTNSSYNLENKINLRLNNILNNQGVPFSKLREIMVVKLDSSKLQ